MALLPLVSPAAPLTPAERERYARHAVLPGIGELGQRRLKAGRVLVIGAGGLGSPTLMYLAAAGVGTIGIVDDDTVESSNLQRQVIHGEARLGHLKVASAAARLADINADVTVIEHPVRLDSSNAAEIISGYDIVIDGADNFSTRFLVNDTCVALGIPDVLGSVLRFDGQVSVFWAQAGPCYRCLFPEPPLAAPSCADAGVFGALCGVVGSLLATQAISLLTGVGDPLIGRFLRIDAASMNLVSTNIVADPQCSTCSQVSRMELHDSSVPVMRSVSAREVQDLLSQRARGDADFRLIDIREPHEFEICAIAGAELIPQQEFLDTLSERNRDESVIIFCRSGVRSAHALAAMHSAGFTDAAHLGGGILEWIDEIDPSMQKY